MRSMVEWRTAALIALTTVSMGCGGVEGSSSDAGDDAAAPVDLDASSACVVQDAGLNVAYTSPDATAGCPPSWTDVTSVPCTVDGQLCVYPEGEAVCRPLPENGGFGWALSTLRSGCSEYPPTQCEACSLPPGSFCIYTNGPEAGAAVSYCCNGNTQQWELFPDGGCPNGKVCGTIHASDYDQTCTTSADCGLVTEGDTCTLPCTACFNAAVNKTARPQYLSDFSSKVAFEKLCSCANLLHAVCDAGVCGIGP
jgi:hypothetical protein